MKGQANTVFLSLIIVAKTVLSVQLDAIPYTTVWTELPNVNISPGASAYLRQPPATNASDCANFCNTNGLCIGAVYRSSDQHCWLLSSYLQFPQAQTDNTVSSFLRFGSAMAGLDYAGNTISSESASSVSDCATKCALKQGCIAGVFKNSKCEYKSLLAGTPVTTDNPSLWTLTAPSPPLSFIGLPGIQISPGVAIFDFAPTSNPADCASACAITPSCAVTNFRSLRYVVSGA
ncbi:hypothetical protein BCR33DRAFT_827532 [Rhizoclosmatium globosum]|uniref:Apple domain-containing protein n=1 Tax=Rhizoclosmatium globosum TaxID=329046 RepID=A0A1Y2C103_9FUNG|nr:hypothetical protein BCR33DRAFT_827532 [Rhizoclosmatium globosum]|eukprot:ORY40699.1 hypothetical protein BCR33DRAFT_827532 [Rhizoclosmatium globosum]